MGAATTCTTLKTEITQTTRFNNHQGQDEAESSVIGVRNIQFQDDFFENGRLEEFIHLIKNFKKVIGRMGMTTVSGGISFLHILIRG